MANGARTQVMAVTMEIRTRRCVVRRPDLSDGWLVVVMFFIEIFLSWLD